VANSLNRHIEFSSIVVFKQEEARHLGAPVGCTCFVCISGPGMRPRTLGDSIKGYWIITDELLSVKGDLVSEIDTLILRQQHLDLNINFLKGFLDSPYEVL